MSTGGPLPNKKDVALSLLERYPTVFIHLDPRSDAVRVPSWFKKQPQLVLQVGLNMPVPIRDLNVDDECISCTLSFSRTPHFCFLPWKSIYALVGDDGRGMVWPDDVPAEVALQAKQAKARPEKKPALRAVERPADAGSDDRGAESPADAEKPRREPARLAAVPPPRAQKSADDNGDDDGGGAGAGKKKLPPYLRVVK